MTILLWIQIIWAFLNTDNSESIGSTRKHDQTMALIATLMGHLWTSAHAGGKTDPVMESIFL